MVHAPLHNPVFMHTTNTNPYTTQITVCPRKRNADTSTTSALSESCALCIRFQNGVANDQNGIAIPSRKEGGESESKTKYSPISRPDSLYGSQNAFTDTNGKSESPVGIRGRTSSPGAALFQGEATAGGLGKGGLFSLFVH